MKTEYLGLWFLLMRQSTSPLAFSASEVNHFKRNKKVKYNHILSLSLHKMRNVCMGKFIMLAVCYLIIQNNQIQLKVLLSIILLDKYFDLVNSDYW